MAFLDNSGDIILDCVLTDMGRQRLGRGDGSFAIRKFALGDDEIDYALYDKTNLNGSAYYDITILQTPVLEANSKGNAGLKSKLISLPNSNILYLPVMQLFLGGTTGTSNTGDTAQHSTNTFVVVSNEATETALGNVDADSGIMLGWRTGLPNDVNIRVDQGLDTTVIPSTYTLDTADTENQWEVKMDNRFGSIAPPPTAGGGSPGGAGGGGTGYNTLDTNNVATYYFNQGFGGSAGGYVTPIGGGGTVPSSIVGPRGMKLNFRVIPSLSLSTDSVLFTTNGRLATTVFTNGATGGNNLLSGQWRYIDSSISIRGINTRSTIEVPVRYIQSV